MSDLVRTLRLLQAWYLPAGPEPEEKMPSKYRAFKEAADEITKLRSDTIAQKADMRRMADIMSDALDVMQTVNGDDDEEDRKLLHIRARMASAIDYVRKLDWPVDALARLRGDSK